MCGPFNVVLIVLEGIYVICFQVSQLPMIFKMLTIAGSVTGGMAATQECIDFCAEKGVEPEIELGSKKSILFTGMIKYENMTVTSRFSLG